MIERPTLYALALFVAVSKHGTMAAVAEAEDISQPTINRLDAPWAPSDMGRTKTESGDEGAGMEFPMRYNLEDV